MIMNQENATKANKLVRELMGTVNSTDPNKSLLTYRSTWLAPGQFEVEIETGPLKANETFLDNTTATSFQLRELKDHTPLLSMFE